MVIRINGEIADITVESERTLGAVLAGIENWLEKSEFRVKGLEIDGRAIPGEAIPAAFERDLAGIEVINLTVCTRRELALEALTEAQYYLGALTGPGSGPDALSAAAEGWENSSAKSFLSEELPDICGVLDEFVKTTGGTGGGPSPQAAASLIDERIREIVDPAEEFERLGSLVSGVSGRLEELPIDIQTGKDGRASETVSLFSRIAEKLFRLFVVFQSQGEFIDTVDSVPVHTFLTEFDAAVKELLLAYSNKDAVLAGDLAEYELAPRLRAFYAALKRSAASPGAGEDGV
ncbi:MAG: hypothetical protein LBE17_01430 [Treponema sp.]|jgi:hypothetical protein|nr:hypothetical protein [Treponema sp.]